MDHWTPRITARAEVGELLLARIELARAAGLTEEDLRVLVTQGRAAEAADQEQTEQLTAASVRVSERSEDARSLFADDQKLKDVVVAVVDDLEATEPALARFLARLSFARYRVRELEETAAPAGEAGAAAPSDAERAEVKEVTLVERADQVSRARSLARFSRALLRPGREAIVAALAARGVDDLAALAARAETLVEAGRNLMTAAEATRREADAVAAQTKKWKAVRRLVRRAVRGEPELERKLAAC